MEGNGRIPRIGLLFGALPEDSPQAEAFRQGLRDLEYTLPDDIEIVFRSAEGRSAELPVLARELAGLPVPYPHEPVDPPVRIIVASSTPAILAARDAADEAAAQHGTDIAVVMTTSGDPVETGLVASLAHPGGRVTGLTTRSPQLSGRRLELLKEAFPEVARVGVLRNPDNPAKVLDWEETQVAARALGVELESLEVHGPQDFEGVLRPAVRAGIDALVVLGEPLMTRERARIVGFAAGDGEAGPIPAMYETRESVEAGGLMAYGPVLLDLYRRAAGYVDWILNGTAPAHLAVEPPAQFELSINLAAAQALGRTTLSVAVPSDWHIRLR
jgi:putative ABC transport system substrate-binding protein